MPCVLKARCCWVFGRFADQAGHRGPLTSSLAIRWARLPAKASRLYWAKRLEAVVGFARYCRIFDDRSQIPSKRMFGPAHRRNPPFLYSQRQLRQLADPGPDSDCPGNLMKMTYATVFGLLACTGLRISEALRLRQADVDLDSAIITVRQSKCRRLRIVPLHPSASAALRTYAKRRDRRFPGADFFFANRSGQAIAYSTIRSAFRNLTIQLGWVDEGKRPRLHDLRHTFASRVLRKWNNRSDGGENRIDWLSIYLGHECVSDTYWYLTAVPDLFAVSAKRFQCPQTTR